MWQLPDVGDPRVAVHGHVQSVYPGQPVHDGITDQGPLGSADKPHPTTDQRDVLLLPVATMGTATTGGQAVSSKCTQTSYDWGPVHPCHDCGALIQYYAGARVHFPTAFEVGTQLRHAPRCAGTARWVAATLAEINRPAWEQPGYYVAAPEPQRVPRPTTRAATRDDGGVIDL